MAAKSNKTAKNKNVGQPTRSGSGVKPESRLKRFGVIAICVIVSLSLMLPVAGIGVASCTPVSTKTSAG
ncbi:MAG TPA: hypothetical protein DEB24_02720 [Coriobacteriia bacterium]|nr:hypothetical protein [Coriobacteriia bacterium]